MTALVPLRLAIGDGDGGQEFARAGVRHANVLGGLFAAIGHFGDVAHEHRLVVGHAGHHVAHVFGGAQKLAGFEQVFAVGGVELAGGQAAVGEPERAGHLQRREVVAREFAFIEDDADFAPLPADQRDGGDIGHLLDGVVHLGRDAPQFEIAVAVAGKRQRQNRHIVDGSRLHQRLRGARRDEVEIGGQLLIEADDALLFVLPHVETHDGQGHAGAGSGVDVLDAGDLPQQFLHRLGDALFHFVGRCAGHLHEDVDHGHDDLRLFLARQFPDGEAADQQRAGDDQRSQLGRDPRVGEAPGGTETAGGAH